MFDYIRFSKMTQTEIDAWFARHGDRVRMAVLEQVSAMPKQGVSSTFKFGTGYGFVQGMLIAHRIPFEYAPPGKWMREMKCLSGGDKKVAKAKAQVMWPDATHKWTLEEPDSFIIAAYCLKMYGYLGGVARESA
jgi:crossover junction endodeoxyribonuclease RuvC